jgi:hypothetical protein
VSDPAGFAAELFQVRAASDRCYSSAMRRHDRYAGYAYPPPGAGHAMRDGD